MMEVTPVFNREALIGQQPSHRPGYLTVLYVYRPLQFILRTVTGKGETATAAQRKGAKHYEQVEGSEWTLKVNLKDIKWWLKYFRIF